MLLPTNRNLPLTFGRAILPFDAVRSVRSFLIERGASALGRNGFQYLLIGLFFSGTASTPSNNVRRSSPNDGIGKFTIPWPPYSAEESDSRMDVTSKMTNIRRNNDAIQRRKIFPLFYSVCSPKQERNHFCAAGFSMHPLEEFSLLNWTICFKNPCSARIEKNTATMAVASTSDADFAIRMQR
ncbi:MAG: hypothetical protein ACTHLX_16575 [Candidatus Binatia bacterium]